MLTQFALAIWVVPAAFGLTSWGTLMLTQVALTSGLCLRRCTLLGVGGGIHCTAEERGALLGVSGGIHCTAE